MTHLIKTIVIIFCLLLALFCISCSEKTVLKYPVTKKSDQVDDYFGTKVKDPYRWLDGCVFPSR